MQNRQLGHDECKRQMQTFPVCILAHDIKDPLNIGSLFRIADAMGVEEIFLSGQSPTPPHKKIRKTSRSTEQYVPFSYHEDPIEIIRKLKSDHYQIISLEVTNSSLDIRNFPAQINARICLIVGSENTGVQQKLLDLSDIIVHIPMMGANSSMNLACACGICLYELTGKQL